MCIAKCTLIRNGVVYKPGQVVSIDDTDAAPLLKDHTIVMLGGIKQTHESNAVVLSAQSPPHGTTDARMDQQPVERVGKTNKRQPKDE